MQTRNVGLASVPSDVYPLIGNYIGCNGRSYVVTDQNVSEVLEILESGGEPGTTLMRCLYQHASIVIPRFTPTLQRQLRNLCVSKYMTKLSIIFRLEDYENDDDMMAALVTIKDAPFLRDLRLDFSDHSNRNLHLTGIRGPGVIVFVFLTC
jgi:hypothetical protein